MANEEKNPPNWCEMRMKSFPYRQRDINRLVMNYLVREAYKETAQRKDPQLDSMEDRLLIRNAIRAGRIQYAMEVAKKLYPKLFETDNYMYFHMQQMQLIELIREREVDQKNSNSTRQSHRLECVCEDRTLTLLACEKLVSGSQSMNAKNELQRKQQHQQQRQEQEELFPGLENCEPKMMFLIKLILWAQNRLEEGGFIDNETLELEGEHFEELLRRAMQQEE